MKNRLSNVKLKETSFVRQGANNKNKFLILKSAGGNMDTKFIEKLKKVNLGNESEIEKALEGVSKSGKEAIKGILRIFKASGEDLPKDTLEKIAKLAGTKMPEIKIPEDVLKAAVDKALADKEISDKAEKDAIEKAKQGKLEMKDVPPVIQKALDAIVKSNEEIKIELKKSNDKNIELEKKLEVENDKRITKEFEGKAAEFKNLSINGADLGSLLKSMSAGMSTEEYKRAEMLLKSADNSMGNMDIFKEIGSDLSGEVGGDKVEKAAVSIRKAFPKLTKEQAYSKALDENPELFV